jgi:hypothetical protein
MSEERTVQALLVVLLQPGVGESGVLVQQAHGVAGIARVGALRGRGRHHVLERAHEVRVHGADVADGASVAVDLLQKVGVGVVAHEQVQLRLVRRRVHRRVAERERRRQRAVEDARRRGVENLPRRTEEAPAVAVAVVERRRAPAHGERGSERQRPGNVGRRQARIQPGEIRCRLAVESWSRRDCHPHELTSILHTKLY